MSAAQPTDIPTVADVRREIATACSLLVGELRSQDADRQFIEDIRAIRRNRNRFATLIVALGLGLVITYVLNSGMLGHLGTVLGPYSFVITVLLDSGLAAYAYIRRY